MNTLDLVRAPICDRSSAHLRDTSSSTKGLRFVSTLLSSASCRLTVRFLRTAGPRPESLVSESNREREMFFGFGPHGPQEDLHPTLEIFAESRQGTSIRSYAWEIVGLENCLGARSDLSRLFLRLSTRRPAAQGLTPNVVYLAVTFAQRMSPSWQ